MATMDLPRVSIRTSGAGSFIQEGGSAVQYPALTFKRLSCVHFPRLVCACKLPCFSRSKVLPSCRFGVPCVGSRLALPVIAPWNEEESASLSLCVTEETREAAAIAGASPAAVGRPSSFEPLSLSTRLAILFPDTIPCTQYPFSLATSSAAALAPETNSDFPLTHSLARW